MENSDGGFTEVHFRIVLKAANLPDIPLTGLLSTSYVKLFGHLVSGSGLASVIIIALSVTALIAVMFFVAIKKTMPKAYFAGGFSMKKNSRNARAKSHKK
jgi:hypothetical protein